MSTAQRVVEFIGGPYDGYHHPVGLMDDGIAERAALPVSENLIRAVSGDEHGPLYPYHSVALYQLSDAAEELQYVFLGEMRQSGNDPLNESID